MAVHLFDPMRHEITTAKGKSVLVEPSQRGHWPESGERLPPVVLTWACQRGIAHEDDEVAVLEFGDAPEPA